MLGSIRGYTISVARLAESVAWYETSLSFRKIDEFVWPGIGGVCTMQGPGFILQIVEPLESRPLPPSESHPDTANLVNGHKHFCLGTTDAARAANELQSAGVEIICMKEVADLSAVFIADNSGCLIELLEHRNKRAPAAVGAPWSIAQNLDHVAISVPDCVEAGAWYSKVLGLAKVAEFEIPEVGLTVVMLAGPGGTVEIFQALSATPLPDERRRLASDLSTVGNKYFTVAVADIAAASKWLREYGISVREQQNIGIVGRAFIRDNSGLLIQLAELS